MKRRIAPAILILACLALGAMAFMRLQANTPAKTGSPYDPGESSPFNTPATAAARDESMHAITAQLNAFLTNDYPRAQEYQLHTFGGMMNFEDMVRFPREEIIHYKSVQFGDAIADQEQTRILFPVAITGIDGVTIHTVCLLGKDQDGVYRIYGWGGPGRRRDRGRD